MNLPQDIIRVLRVIEYEGPRDKVEKTVANSIQGEQRFGINKDLIIRAATVGVYPQLLENVTADPRQIIERKDV